MYFNSTKKNLLLSIVIAIFSFLFVQCGDDSIPGKPNEVPDHNPPVQQIKPSPGMDLYGLILDNDGKPVSNIVVSDGYTCTATNQKGVYEMKKNSNATLVYYSTPSNYEVNTASETTKMSVFYTELNSNNKRYDFKLKKLSAIEKEFTLLAIGDPQVTNVDEVRRFKEETMADIKKFVSTQTNPCYGIALGDIVGDKPAFFEQMKSLMGSTEMKVHTTLGNHDKVAHPSDSKKPRNTEAFNRTFGPVNYSFNRGDVHFVSLDNIIFSDASTYTGGFSNEQVEWLKQDLSFVSKDKMIIVYYHIPLRNHSYNNRSQILELLKGYAEVHLMAGHTHYNENFTIDSPISAYEHIHGASCGSWWHSTLNGDGTPNGYAVYHISGPTIKEWFYKPTNYSKDFQIRLHKGNVVFGGQNGYYTFNQVENTIVANIWNSDNKWKIEAIENGIKVAELQSLSTSLKDSWTLGYHIGILNRNPDNYSPPSKHLYLHKMQDPNAKLQIRATDRFGNIYTQSEIVSDFTTAISYK